MNGAMSIILPMPTIIIQFPGGHQQHDTLNLPCVHCGQYNLLKTDDIKEGKIEIKEDVIDVKEDVINVKEEENDIKENMINIKEENFDFDSEMGEYILHKDPNLYANMFSPISDTESEDVESSELFVSEHQDESFEAFYKKWFSDISEMMQSLKDDICD